MPKEHGEVGDAILGGREEFESRKRVLVSGKLGEVVPIHAKFLQSETRGVQGGGENRSSK